MEDMLTVEEVAAKLKVERESVRRWIRSGELPATKLGRVFRVHPDDLARFLDARKVGR